MDPTPAIRFESDPLLLKLAMKGSIIQRQNLTQFVHVYGKAVAEKGLREVDKLRPESRCRSSTPFDLPLAPKLLKDPQGLAQRFLSLRKDSSSIPFPGATLNPYSNFFLFRVALNS